MYNRRTIYLSEQELYDFHDELVRFIQNVSKENVKLGNSSMQKSIEFPSGLSFVWKSSKNKSEELNPYFELTIIKNDTYIGVTNSGELSMVIKRGLNTIEEFKKLKD